MKKFVTYLTTYKGHSLPPFYIGSTTIEKANSGKYFGSVKSKKYKEIFEFEVKNHPELFEIQVLSEHDTRKEALAEELRLQKENDAVHSPLFFNESYASVNGFFGRKVFGKDNPAFGRTNKSNTGRTLSKKHRENISKGLKGRIQSETTKNKISNSHKGLKHSEETKKTLSDKAKELRVKGKGNPPPPPMFGTDNPRYGKPLSDDIKKKISDSLIGKNNNPKSIKVKKLDLNKNLIKEYNSLREAEIENEIPLGKIRFNTIRKGVEFYTLNEIIWNVTLP